MAEETKERIRKGAPIRRAATGGIMGATVGYLSTPKNRKKLVAKVSNEALKKTSSSVGTFTKDKLNSIKDSGKEKSGNAYAGLKSSASNLFKKDNDEDESSDTEDAELVQENDEENEMSNSGQAEQDYEDLKEENQMLQDRLQSLEEKMDKLLFEDGDEEEDDEPAKSKTVAKKKSEKEKDNADDEEEDEDEKSSENVKKTKKTSAKKSSSPNRTKKTKKEESKNEDESDDTSIESDDDTSS